jgi:hypothetical protein
MHKRSLKKRGDFPGRALEFSPSPSTVLKRSHKTAQCRYCAVFFVADKVGK